jgi:asparaginyl-tRNA synthetase
MFFIKTLIIRMHIQTLMLPELEYTFRCRYITIKEPRMVCILKVQDEIISSLRDYLRSEGFIEILAPIIGPVTDPGIRGAKQVSINYYGSEFKLMSSMILYKQMAITAYSKIFALSPNIRMEPLETIKTRRHLTEFRQIDIEEAHATYEEMMQLAEKMLCHAIENVKKNCNEELEELGRRLHTPKIPFKRYTYHEAVEVLNQHGFNLGYENEIPWTAEEALSAINQTPFWITDYPVSARGFYYLEHADRHGMLRDFDLLYPEGYGEAISGGEREYKHDQILERIKTGGEDPAKYAWYLQMLKEGIPSSAGFGIGVERLTRFICGVENIWEAVPFPKVAGIISP